MIADWKLMSAAPKDGAGRGMFENETRRREIIATNGSSLYLVFWNGHSWDDGDFQDHIDGLTHWDDVPPLPSAD